MSIQPTPSTARRPGRPRNSASREQFLDAAVHLFSTQGIAATTVAHIAREVGVTSAMVHYHFASRDLLIDAIVAERIQPFLNAMWAPLFRDGPIDPVAVLQENADCILDHVLTLPWMAPLWLADISSPEGELSQRVMQHMPAERIIQLTDAIQAAQQRGEINPHLQPHMIFMTMVGLILVPFASLGQCRMLHKDADFSAEALRRHAKHALTALLQPQ